ncbi:MAG: DNA repair protein RecO [Planctomycetota bacterium]
MPRFADEAVCVRSQEWSETSQLVVLVTRERGKVRGLAKGSRRGSPGAVERYSGGIGLLTRGQVVATTRRTGLASVTEWDLRGSYPGLRGDLSAWRAGMVAADVADALLAEEDPCGGTFELLVGLLAEIGKGGVGAVADAAEAALLRFLWGMLGEAGVRPEVRVDVATGEALPTRKAYVFSPDAGGLVETGSVADWKVRAETVERLRGLEQSDGAGRGAETDRRANRLLLSYLRHHLGKQLPTMGWWLDDV